LQASLLSKFCALSVAPPRVPLQFVAPCSSFSAPQQLFNFDPTYGGVIGSAMGGGCMCSQANSTAGALAFDVCEGPGDPLHEQEVGYNYTGAGPIPKSNSAGLCVTAAAGGVAALAPCGSAPAAQGWVYMPSKQFVLTSNTSMCLSAGAVSPPPLLSNVFGSHMVLQARVR
jgi:hypothetical protein